MRALILLLLCGPVWSQEAVLAEDPVPTVVASSTEAAVNVIWPRGLSTFPHIQRSFTFGTATPGSTLTINGQVAALGEDGAFFEMVDLGTGTFALQYDVSWQGQSSSTSRLVTIGTPHALPETASDELVALEPAVNFSGRPGDVVRVACKGPSGLSGVFRINGLSSKLPLVEVPGKIPGLYKGHYIIQPGDRGKDLKTTCGLKTGFWGGLSAEAPGHITIEDPSQVRVAVTKHQVTVLKTLQGGYSMFWPPGVKLEITGKSGKLLRVRLSEHESGWVDASRVALLPEGTPPPHGRIGRYLNTEVQDDRVLLRMNVSEALPFEVRQEVDPLRYVVRFFGADQRFDRIRFESHDPVYKDVRWRQESSKVVRVDVATKLSWGWGYDAYYQGDQFVLEVRRPPDLTRTENVLAGRRIVLDAGHGAWASAIGPRGATERDANMAIAAELEAQLLAEGAEVYMIRTSSEGPSLLDRTFLAAQAGGDVYLSIHNNAFPVTADPRKKPRGFMIFYYHPQSRPLAEAVHAEYSMRHDELADEFVRWGDLYVCRMTQMPAILTESAYIILPEQEKRLLDPSYRRALAATTLSGLRAYFTSYRALQLKSSAERAAASE
jgi:N-acetylmuramoyl-L-alanine amidase